jgi:hypothetical protein
MLTIRELFVEKVEFELLVAHVLKVLLLDLYLYRIPIQCAACWRTEHSFLRHN